MHFSRFLSCFLPGRSIVHLYGQWAALYFSTMLYGLEQKPFILVECRFMPSKGLSLQMYIWYAVSNYLVLFVWHTN